MRLYAHNSEQRIPLFEQSPVPNKDDPGDGGVGRKQRTAAIRIPPRRPVIVLIMDKPPDKTCPQRAGRFEQDHSAARFERTRQFSKKLSRCRHVMQRVEHEYGVERFRAERQALRRHAHIDTRYLHNVRW